jgi:glycosyltransferase involved in cell wall biosynthesis
MKIAHVVDSMDMGGAEMMILSLCEEHQRLGHNVSVDCLYRKGVLVPKLEALGVPVRLHGPGNFWKIGRKLYRSLRERRIEAVHCHNVVASIIGMPAARFAGAGAVISTRHGISTPPFTLRRHGAFWLAARCADRVVAVCSQARQNLALAPFAMPAKLTSILNGARPAASLGSRPELGNRGVVAIMVARLAPPKDHATLLHALANASQRCPDLELWIVGDGPDHHRLVSIAAELQIQNRVRFLGECSDVGDLLTQADLFVLSSRSEGVPISVLEALAAGLPVIVSAVGGMPEVVDLSGAGLSVQPSDLAALTDALVTLASHESIRRSLGQRARAAYLAHFTLTRMAEQYLNLYTECFRERRAGLAAAAADLSTGISS